ncbi:Mpa43p SCDLUD_003923 [Saccharomycodes ludwigii]|uniref:Mpa43p n=1 Tax=Saccharomycodes ludwigii TaxID=36035 RepID=UPI001E8824D0|nr:hypothetical protein SCDLUD_003923 [Saccharomycodes ludwigii]KAH3899642.1 hypothetical protein SCDLUD_003923 [Saccharomycodes ludwigii]
MKDIGIESKPLGVGLDLGSSAVRISLFDYENDNLLSTTSQKVAYYINDNDPCIFKYTQSTPEILCAIDQCFKNLKIDKFHQNIKSFGIAATCSMVVLNNNSEPYNLIPNNLGKIHDVIFWMDSSSVQECKEANKLIDSSEKDKLGGSGFIAEMAVPKLIRLFKFKKNVVVMDLHKYIAYIMCKKFNWSFKSLVDIPNKNGVAHDGELSGWSNPNILKLVDEAASRIGPVIDTDTKNVMNITSHIDCYTSWFSTFPKPDKSVCVVAGTSTCFLFASSRDNLVIPGVWGPFTNVFEKNNFDKDINVYESGQQTTASRQD